jgi:multidrug efflux pump subunit AcrB
MTTRTNLSALALKYSTLTVFFMIALTAAGIYAFFNLGRGEDPPFTIKQMVVSAAWPGATSREVEQQVTEKIETKLQELPYFFNVTSYTKPGETVIYVSLRDDTPPSKVPDLWYQVRKKVGDIRSSLPQGVVGPFFNDEYGDTYSMIWAFESDGFSPAEVKEIVKAVRQRLLRVPDVTKADLMACRTRRSTSSSVMPGWPCWACRSTRFSRSCAGRMRSWPQARSKPAESASPCVSMAPQPRQNSSWHCPSRPMDRR